MTFKIYKLFDQAGVLLYVGKQTGTSSNRAKYHAKRQPWGNEIAKVELLKFLSSAERCIAEVELIRKEKPKYNKIKFKNTSMRARRGKLEKKPIQLVQPAQPIQITWPIIIELLEKLVNLIPEHTIEAKKLIYAALEQIKRGQANYP